MFQKPTVILKIVLKVGNEYTLMNERKGELEQKFDAALGTIFRICNCFQKPLYLFFS